MVIELRQREDLDRLLDQSKSAPVLIFKHSTQCPVSDAAYDEFVQFTHDTPEVTCGIVLVVEDRALSNTIEATLHIRHESPQAIVVENGSPRWKASHWDITSQALSKAIKGQA